MPEHYYYGLGRRKRATARVRLMNGSGEFKINNKPAQSYFDDSKHILNVLKEPFAALELSANKYNISAKVNGSGHSSQVDAIRLGIAKALSAMNEDYKGTLRRNNQLGRDPREKERKKFGLKGARKQRQFTKR